MPRHATAALAFALGASAMPAAHWPSWGSWGQPSWGSYGGGSGSAPSDIPSAFPSFSAPIPTGSGVAPPPVGSSQPAFTYSQIANATIPSYVGVASGTGSASPSYSSSAAEESASAPAVTSAPSTPASGGAASGGDIPASSGTSVLDAVQTIAAGETFDGGMVAFDRGVSCTGQEEGGDSDAVFEIEDGGSLSNVIIGPNQIEGVHCYGSCTCECRPTLSH